MTLTNQHEPPPHHFHHQILEQLTQFGLRRREPVVAIGGGVILDIVGMAANLYRRGVPYIRCVCGAIAWCGLSVWATDS